MQRLETFYFTHVVTLFKSKYNLDNIYMIPRLEKIVINRGFDESCQNKKVLDVLLNEINLISSQSASLRNCGVSIANFKVKKKMPVGMTVTLRGTKMYSFLDRLINLSLPRVRDFQGLNPLAFDGRGNYNLGLKEVLMFPEVDFDKVVKVKGVNISIVFKNSTDIYSYVLLKELGMPFRK